MSTKYTDLKKAHQAIVLGYEKFSREGNNYSGTPLKELTADFHNAQKDFEDFFNEDVSVSNIEGSDTLKREQAMRVEKIRSFIPDVMFEAKDGELVFVMISNTDASAEELFVALSLLPDGLQGLSCYDNPNLTTLPKLPDGLEKLYCRNNPKLTTLPKLPDGLRILSCHDNLNLTTLPKLPDGLGKLYCYDNPNLTTLPKLPDGLRILSCHDNLNLTTLPKLPDTLTFLNIQNTPASKNSEIRKRLEEFKTRTNCKVLM